MGIAWKVMPRRLGAGARLHQPSPALVGDGLLANCAAVKDFCRTVKGIVRRTSIAMYTEYRKGPDGIRRKLYCVQWPKIGRSRHRQYFSDRQEARRLFEQKLSENARFGVAHLAFSDKQRVEYAECSELLRPYGKGIREAVEHFVAYLKVSERSIGVTELVAELILSRQRAELSERYLRDLRSRLGRFAEGFGERLVSAITTQEIDDWLHALKLGPVPRNNHRRVVSTLFSYALDHRYTISNPAAQTVEAKKPDAPPRILSVQQTARLLEATTPELLPYIAIGAFAGLRRAELERMDWRSVDLDSGLIEVTAMSAKTARRRLVKIQPNLREWLLPVRKQKGSVVPTNFPKRFDAARESAGIVDWPDNALRHSFASYHLAHFKNQDTLALEMGNSTAIIFRHYRELVKPDDAALYWSIKPKTAGKIIPLAASN